MDEKKELEGQGKDFLGDYYWALYQKIKLNKKEFELFKKFPIDVNKSYLVYGNTDLLEKFKAFYLTRCIKKRPRYAQFFIREYAETLSGNTKDEFGLGVDFELLFIYRHNHMQTIGNSELWLCETVLNKIAERNRDGWVTVVLSEQRMPILEKCGELEIINLSKVVLNQTIQEVTQDMSARAVTNTIARNDFKASVSSNGTVY